MLIYAFSASQITWKEHVKEHVFFFFFFFWKLDGGILQKFYDGVVRAEP